MSAWSAAKTWENELNEKDAGGWWGVDAQRRLGGSNKAQQLVASKSENSSAFLQCGFPILFPDLVAWPQDDIPGVGAHLSPAHGCPHIQETASPPETPHSTPYPKLKPNLSSFISPAGQSSWQAFPFIINNADRDWCRSRPWPQKPTKRVS